MTYEETLNFLYKQLPMFQRVGSAAFKKDLTNINALLEELNYPQQTYACIHVGGTNGKGSVAHLLSAALQSAGYKAGLYTSPHYKDFRERIKVDGTYVSEAFVVDFVAQIQSSLERIRPSFFEITVAMAFAWFAKEKVDIAIVEVGLGGRLDSTNVIMPELSVITNISLDHQQFLGDTLPAIAAEKAGIIKKETPVVIGETHKETAPVFRKKALQESASLLFADQLFQVVEEYSDSQYTTYQVFRNRQLYTQGLEVNIHGPFQHLNIQTALAALEVWQQHHNHRVVPFSAVEKGWKNLRELTNYQGRWQILSEEPRVLVDSAHNEGGLKAILDSLKKTKGQLHIVMAVVSDKKLDEVLPLFPDTAYYYFSQANIQRALGAEQLQKTAAIFGLNGDVYPTVQEALEAAKNVASSIDTIFVGGSVFTVAEVL